MSATEKINETLESTWFHELAKKISEQFCIYHIIAINRNAFQNGRSNAKRQSSMNLALIRVQIERFLVHPFSLSDMNEEKSTYIRISQYFGKESLLHYVYVLSHFSCIWHLATLWTVTPPGSLCPWDFIGKNIGVGCHVFLQGIFQTQGLNPCLMFLSLAGRFFSTRVNRD